MPLGSDYEPLDPPPVLDQGGASTQSFNPGQGPGVQANSAPGTQPYTGPTGPMNGQGYDPSMGSYEGFKDARRAYRSRFQPGGDVYERQQEQNWKILAARPQTKQQLAQLLNSMGIFNQKEMGKARFNSLMMDFDNGLSGNYHYDGQGNKFNVATSDKNAGWEPLTAEDYANLNKGFYGRLEEMVGVPQFQNWQKKGGTGLTKDPATGLLFNVRPNGTKEYFDSQGFRINPQTGQRIGFYGYGNF